MIEKKNSNACVQSSYLPILVSSSNSEGERFVFRHNAAITPIWHVKQQAKSIISNNNKIPPTAIAIIDDELHTRPSIRITKSLPKNVSFFFFICTNPFRNRPFNYFDHEFK